MAGAEVEKDQLVPKGVAGFFSINFLQLIKSACPESSITGPAIAESSNALTSKALTSNALISKAIMPS